MPQNLKPTGLYFGDILDDHCGDFIVGGNYIRRGIYNRVTHTQIRITNLCLFTLHVDFFSSDNKKYTLKFHEIS